MFPVRQKSVYTMKTVSVRHPVLTSQEETPAAAVRQNVEPSAAVSIECFMSNSQVDIRQMFYIHLFFAV